MKTIIQDESELDIIEDITLSNNKISYQGKIIGIYENRKIATQVFAEMMDHGWNNKEGVYRMPKK